MYNLIKYHYFMILICLETDTGKKEIKVYYGNYTVDKILDIKKIGISNDEFEKIIELKCYYCQAEKINHHS